ncbi:MAG: alpha/beta fold hydrolase [Candidatus Eisenbacteria bacterium]
MPKASASDLLLRESGRGPRLILVHGSLATAHSAFAAQEELERDHRLVWIERRGAGVTPGVGPVDFAVDARDLGALLDEPAHMIGHSYGAIGCLLAALARPEKVRGLVLIEPPFYRAAADHAAVRALLPRLEAVYRAADPARPAEYWESFRSALGYPQGSPSPRFSGWRECACAAMTERPPWEASLPGVVDPSLGPKVLIVSGDWARAPEEARRLGGAALRAVADALAHSLGSARLTVPGASHAAQHRATEFNQAVRAHLARQ